MVAKSEERANQLMQEAEKKAASQTESLVAEYEKRARQILQEAEKISATPPQQRPGQILKTLAEKASEQSKAKAEARQELKEKRVDLVIIPPVNFAQMTKLRVSLQGFQNLRVLSTGGSLDIGATISIWMDEPFPLVDELKKLGTIDEAINEAELGSHPLGDFLKKALPVSSQKKRDGQRILVVLNRE
jgi:hypothetical protein